VGRGEGDRPEEAADDPGLCLGFEELTNIGDGEEDAPDDDSDDPGEDEGSPLEEATKIGPGDGDRGTGAGDEVEATVGVGETGTLITVEATLDGDGEGIVVAMLSGSVAGVDEGGGMFVLAVENKFIVTTTNRNIC